MLDVAEHFEQRLVPAGLGGDELLAATRHRPRLLDPLVGDVAAENVEPVAIDADRVTDDVTVRPDPAEIFAMGDRDLPAGPDAFRHAVHRYDAAPRHHLGE